MYTLQSIKNDLIDLRYYFANREHFENISNDVAPSSVLMKVKIYNEAIKDAPAQLYDLFVSLYTKNYTQASLAKYWGYSDGYIKYLNNKLCKHLLSVLNKTQNSDNICQT